MQAHPTFHEILMHTDEELAEVLGGNVLERTTIHQWPLSCVQKIGMDNGKTFAYKAQLPPSVECAFYERASSALLPRHRMLGIFGPCDTMVLDWVEAPLLRDILKSQSDLVNHGSAFCQRSAR